MKVWMASNYNLKFMEVFKSYESFKWFLASELEEVTGDSAEFWEASSVEELKAELKDYDSYWMFEVGTL